MKSKGTFQMTRVAQMSYAVAGACFAATLTMATSPDWWDQHGTIAFLLGVSMPLCIMGAWLSEFRVKQRKIFGVTVLSHSPGAIKIAAWCGIGAGMLSLTLFLFTFSSALALGFSVGAGLLSLLAGIQELPNAGSSD